MKFLRAIKTGKFALLAVAALLVFASSGLNSLIEHSFDEHSRTESRQASENLEKREKSELKEFDGLDGPEPDHLFAAIFPVNTSAALISVQKFHCLYQCILGIGNSVPIYLYLNRLLLDF